MKRRRPSRQTISLAVAIVLIFSLVTIATIIIFRQQSVIAKQDANIAKLRSMVGWSSEYDDINSVPFQIDDGEMINYINDVRSDKGLGRLTVNEALNRAACLKADDMIDKRYWSHTSPEGKAPWYFFDQVGYGYVRAGENLAYGQRTSRNVVDGWVRSSTHYANIVGDYTETGICHKVARYRGDTNTVIVSLFGKHR